MKLKQIIIPIICITLLLFGCSKVIDKIDFMPDSSLKFNSTNDHFELKLPIGTTYYSNIKVETYSDILYDDVDCISEDVNIATISILISTE